MVEGLYSGMLNPMMVSPVSLSLKLTPRVAFCQNVAAVVKAIVVNVDYRLAPEYPYPVPVEDSYTALLWVSILAFGRSS